MEEITFALYSPGPIVNEIGIEELNRDDHVAWRNVTYGATLSSSVTVVAEKICEGIYKAPDGTLFRFHTEDNDHTGVDRAVWGRLVRVECRLLVEKFLDKEIGFQELKAAFS